MGAVQKSQTTSVPVGLALPSLQWWHSREPLLPLGFPARHHAGCRKRSDQLPQGPAGLPDAAGRPFPSVVDAAGGDPLDPERPGLTGGDGAICQTLSPDPQRAARHGFRQVALGFQVQAAASPAGRGWL